MSTSPVGRGGVAKGKIKQAYGHAKNQEWNRLYAQGVRDKAQLEQRSRDAGRKAEIITVREFLGGVPIDHFVEVTLGGFYELAKVVEPITVCLNKATADRYSGANFRKGEQEINAAQAVAFVRQRRDTQYADVLLRVVIGSGFTMPASSSSSSPTRDATTSAPEPADLLQGGQVTCVN